MIRARTVQRSGRYELDRRSMLAEGSVAESAVADCASVPKMLVTCFRASRRDRIKTSTVFSSNAGKFHSVAHSSFLTRGSETAANSQSKSPDVLRNDDTDEMDKGSLAKASKCLAKRAVP